MSDDNPCVGICEIDESGYCVGCGRSADEIFGNTDSDNGTGDAALEASKPVPGDPAQAAD